MGNYVKIIAVQFGCVPMNELLLDGLGMYFRGNG